MEDELIFKRRKSMDHLIPPSQLKRISYQRKSRIRGSRRKTFRQIIPQIVLKSSPQSLCIESISLAFRLIFSPISFRNMVLLNKFSRHLFSTQLFEQSAPSNRRTERGVPSTLTSPAIKPNPIFHVICLGE